jgi:GNAT superfamily N-acetyltransferase
MESYRRSPWADQLPDFVYWSHFGHVGLVEALLSRSTVLVACLPDRPRWLYGWAAADGGELHYAFVRYEFRKQGIGRALYAALAGPKTITHVTPEGSQWLSKLGVKPLFSNPYREMK